MRGLNVPSFYKNRMFKEKVHTVIAAAITNKPELFLISVSVSDAFKISVVIDGDNGVNLQDCIDVSKQIEATLDREEQDYSLEVASAGIASPLKLIRQYKKNIGRTLSIKTKTENIEAELVKATDDFVILSWQAREPKKLGKGKETVHKELQIPYSEILEAVVIITF